MEKKKISIIIPAYNAEKYISESLETILSQSYKNLEIIIINDGSKDNTQKVLEEYESKYPNIKVINKQNEGVSRARNDGLDIATGDYIGFVDSDDQVEPEMFERLIENAEKYDCDISHCGYKLIRPDGMTFDFYGTYNLKQQDNYEGIKDLLEGKIVEPGIWNKLFKRELLEGIRFPENIRFNEDLYFCVLAFAKAKTAVFYDAPLYRYFLREGSATTTGNINRIDDIMWVAKHIGDLFTDEKYIELARTRYCNVCIQMYHCNLRENKLSKEKTQNIKSEFFATYKKLKQKDTRLIMIYIGQKYLCSLYNWIYKTFYKKKYNKRKHKV